jgi:hypothetical protein
MRTLLAVLLCCAAGAQSLFINAGGPALPPDPTNTTYQADQYFNGGVAWVDATMGAGIWQTLRYAPQFSYDIPVPNGFYNVKLDLSEPNKTGPSQRIFTITANGIQSDPIDIFKQTGAINVQMSTTLLVMVGSGHLRLNFQATLGNAVVSAIEVTPSGPGAPCPDPATIQGTGIYAQETDAKGNPTGNCLPLIPIPGTIAQAEGTWQVQGSYQQIPPPCPIGIQCPPGVTWKVGKIYQVFAVPASTFAAAQVQWFQCAAPCQGINLVNLKLNGGSNITLYMQQTEPSFQFDPTQWVSVGQ